MQNKERIERPRFLGRYELIGALARGGMGTVYLARHAGVAGFHRLFAIKILHKHLAEKSSFVDMLRDEARFAARLHHPNVVPVVDLGTDGEDHYIVLDYVEGPSFSKLWKQSNGKLPRELLVSIVIDALDGLHAAHILKDENGDDLRLVHRDVSPSNILVGIDGIARITDFGIAKAKSRITSTQPGTVKGSLQYMSPEQIKNVSSIDCRTDIWSVGVILWNVLTCERLFEADNDGAIVEAILNKEVRPPSITSARPPACFDEVVLRALERDREKRFASALEMADALRKIAAEHGMMGSRQQLASWVEGLFGDDLERRRAEVRNVVNRRSATPITNEVSRVTVLPFLSTPPPSIPLDKMTANSFPSEEEISTGQTTVPELWIPRIRRKHLWLALALVAAVSVAMPTILYYIYHRPTRPPTENIDWEAKKSGDKKPASPSDIAQPDLSPVSVENSEPSAPKSKSHRSIEKDLERNLSQENDNDERSRRPYRRVRGAQRSAISTTVAPKAISSPEDRKYKPVAVPVPSPSPAPPSSAPQRTSPSEAVFEKNPYLMH